jgi:SAM-dependent methyltransferase
MSLEQNLLYQIIKRLYVTMRSIWLQGNKFICPCCEGNFREFLMAGVHKRKRKNARCPRCGSLERHRLLWLYLKNKTSFLTDKTSILDVAPMECLQTKFKQLKNIHYVGVDMDSHLAMLTMDLTAIPMKDNSFDCIICYHVLEHISDDQEAMRELFRVLKPGGVGILQSPVDLTLEKTFEDPTIVSPKDRAHHFGQEDHVRIYGKDYEERLQKAGFIIKKEYYPNELGEVLVEKYRLTDEKEIFLCLKP